jgi:hypothetical protein
MWGSTACALAAEIGKSDQAPLGTLDPRAKGGYVVRQEVRKCQPEEIDGYTDRVREQATEFIDHYAKVLSRLEDVIQEHLPSSQAAGSKG